MFSTRLHPSSVYLPFRPCVVAVRVRAFIPPPALQEKKPPRPLSANSMFHSPLTPPTPPHPLSPAVNTTHLHHPPPHPPIPRYLTLTRYPISTFQAPGCPSRPPTCFLCSSHILRSTLPLLLPPSPVHLCQNIGSSRSQLEPHPQGHPKTGGSTWFFIHFLARLARVSSAHFFEAA